MVKEIMDKVDYVFNQNKHNMKKENSIEYICSDAILILHGIKEEKVPFEDIKNVISNNLISFSTLALYDIRLDKDVDLVSLMDIKNIYYNGCSFTKTTDITISSQLERIIIQNSNFQKLKIKDDKENKKSINLYIYNTTCYDFYLNKCLVNEFSLSEFEVANKAKISSHFSGKISLNDTTFNKYISFEGSSFDEVFETTDLYFDDYKKVVFEFEKITSFSKEDISNYINNYGKTDEEKLNLASKLQNTFRKFKDIALAHNNKIYAKECEKLELFVYEIYLRAERDMKSKELRKIVDDKKQSKQKTTNKSISMWKATLEHLMLKFYEITSEHHTNFAMIIYFTLAIIFSLYLELFIIKIFIFFNIDYFNHVLDDYFTGYRLGIFYIVLIIFALITSNSRKPMFRLICIFAMILSIAYLFFNNYFIFIYFIILIIVLSVFYVRSRTIYHWVSIFTAICFICFPIFSKNITTPPSIYYLDNTLSKYAQEDIREALKIASVENQEKLQKTKKDSESKQEPKEESKPSQNEVSSNISINQAQELYDLYFGTNIVNLSAKNAQNIQDIKQFIKDNKLLMYYTSVKSSNETYNDIIKAIWIDLQLDTIYFIFFIIMILCIYSMQKTFRKNTI
ncbi:hypothetical protein [Campylobacter sp. RM12651]|uniref:hypothetical protein n=1 Tax=Campylobacter sp. RM12651 TaxID=1660079 RepID=UPI001EFA902C|nr:hypothetical protein [Campylobacter sp. RM12651]ULO02610.1 putative membrane protein [Campylobacter sp. RM12651]